MRKFSGIKFVPPGLHLITWSPPTGSSGPSSIPLRSSILRWFKPQERLLLRYNPATEGVDDVDGLITDDRLKALDAELAPYPFEGGGRWRSLITHITPEVVKSVLGEKRKGRIDGMTGVVGVEEEDVRLNEKSGTVEREEKLRFPEVDPKRSWREGAVGEEVTRYARDKSWQFGHVVERGGGGESGSDQTKARRQNLTSPDVRLMLAYLQLAFILLLHLSSYSGLQMYQRLLVLFTRSHSLLSSPGDYIASTSATQLRKTYTALLHSLCAQLGALPPNAFDAELPEMDVFYLDEIESLRIGLAQGICAGDAEVQKGWEALRNSARRWGWSISPLSSVTPQAGQDEESDEEGEYAPQIVET